MRVGVRLLADQFDVGPLLAHQLDELLRAQGGALIVVRDDLRHRDAGLVDLAIDQEGGNAGGLGLLDRGDRGIGTGIVEDDGRRLAADGGVEFLVLLVGVVVVRQHQRLVAQGLGLGFGTLRLGGEERIVVRRRDDGDQLAVGMGGTGFERERGDTGGQNDGEFGKTHGVIPPLTS